MSTTPVEWTHVTTRLSVGPQTPPIGRLEVVVGPMFAGKTSELLHRGRRLEVTGHQVLALKHSMDGARYTADSLATHDGRRMICCSVPQLGDVVIPDSVTVLLVDEVQFFDADDVAAFIAEHVVRRNRTVIMAGLSRSWKGTAFPAVTQLFHQADSVIHLTAVCMQCRARDAPFTVRINPTDSRELVAVGGPESYRAVCRLCDNA